MKKVFLLFFAFSIISSLNIELNAQCKNFAKNICKLELNPFIHDGNYHAAILTEGEDAELYKTFFSGQEYRIAICGTEQLPGIEFKVLDSKRQVLYNNKDNDNSLIWDFKLEATQQLIITISINNNEEDNELVSGCVAIMFGLLDN